MGSRLKVWMGEGWACRFDYRLSYRFPHGFGKIAGGWRAGRAFSGGQWRVARAAQALGGVAVEFGLHY